MSNYIQNIAFIGASGNSGKGMVKELLATGKHKVTAITRADSKSELPEGVQVSRIDYNDVPALVSALQGHDALVITLGVSAPGGLEQRVISAAAEAGVHWILPNDWSPDTQDVQFAREALIGEPKEKMRAHFKTLNRKSNYIAVSTGFWYEWSLAIEGAFGFNFEKRKATYFGDGDVKINTSTWPQVGRAVAALLSLPVHADGDQPCLEKYKNGHVYVSSFLVSQKDMFESVLRVTGSKAEDWTITKQDVKERYDAGLQEMQAGDRLGFAKAMYTRIFFPDGKGMVEKRYGLLNDVLGLPKEDLDAATEAAIERSKTFTW